jgi:hypothetical protein
LCTHGELLIGGNSGNQLLRSSDNGVTWDLGAGTWYVTVTGFAEDKNGSIYLSSQKIASQLPSTYRSDDLGATWRRIDDSAEYAWGNSILITQAGTILVGQYDSIRRSTNGGLQWESVRAGGENSKFRQGKNGEIYSIGINAVMRSFDDGLMWDTVRTPYWYIRDFSVDSLGWIYVSNDTGMIKTSSDDGRHWSELGKTPVKLYILEFDSANCAYIADGSTLLRSTTPLSIFASSVHPILTRDDVAINVSQRRDAFHFSIGLPSAQNVEIELHSITGVTLQRLHREAPGGTSEIEFNTNDFAPGCYWYTARGDGWTKSGKVMKLP